MAETITQPVKKSLFGFAYTDATKVINASEVDYSAASRRYTFKGSGLRHLVLGLIFANYTGVTVKLQKSFDGGTTWEDVPGASLSTSGTSVIVEGPFSEDLAINVAATLSVGADTLAVWLTQEWL